MGIMKSWIIHWSSKLSLGSTVSYHIGGEHVLLLPCDRLRLDFCCGFPWFLLRLPRAAWGSWNPGVESRLHSHCQQRSPEQTWPHAHCSSQELKLAQWSKAQCSMLNQPSNPDPTQKIQNQDSKEIFGATYPYNANAWMRETSLSDPSYFIEELAAR